MIVPVQDTYALVLKAKADMAGRHSSLYAEVPVEPGPSKKRPLEALASSRDVALLTLDMVR